MKPEEATARWGPVVFKSPSSVVRVKMDGVETVVVVHQNTALGEQIPGGYIYGDNTLRFKAL